VFPSCALSVRALPGARARILATPPSTHTVALPQRSASSTSSDRRIPYLCSKPDDRALVCGRPMPRRHPASMLVSAGPRGPSSRRAQHRERTGQMEGTGHKEMPHMHDHRTAKI
jgi:hypothetical protein